MAKEYIGSQEHFEDEINAYYDQKEEIGREMQNQYEKEMMEQMERDDYESNLETMTKVSDNFIDLTDTSPPYDNLRKPRLTDFYDELDPRGCSGREYSDYLEALDEWKQSIEDLQNKEL